MYKLKYCLKWGLEQRNQLILTSRIRQLLYRLYIRRHYESTAISSDDLSEIPAERIRNFSIIAHVDHGKSTLADRFLEITGLISKDSGRSQVLDNLQVEKERGITVKAQAVSLCYQHNDKFYLLNLIDTPGHVDFSNEVSRSLSVCDGVILLVEAIHGIQAQTVANYSLAKSRNLQIVPVINKIDIKHADPDRVCRDLQTLFGIDSAQVLRVSAKLGTGVESVLQNVIERIPPPVVNRQGSFRALVFDSWYDRYRGALSLVFILDGSIFVGQDIQSSFTSKIYAVKSLSLLRPGEVNVQKLVAGQVGVIGCNMRNSKESLIGDTFHLKMEQVEPFKKFTTQQPMVFAGVYPADQSKHVALRSAIDKLVINDSAVTVAIETSPALGQGWRLGFLGILHMEVFCQRLEQEHGAEPIISAPSVTYKIKLCNRKLIKQHGSDTIQISNASLFPDKSDVQEYLEPLVKGTIITPTEYMGAIIGLCIDHRGVQEKSMNIDNDRLLMTYILPLGEIMLDFNDNLKSISSGYASFNYEDYGYHPTNIVKLDIHLNGRPVDELCRIVHVSKATTIARQMVLKLKEQIPRQMIQIAVQACVGSKVLARETIKPYRKDVTAKLLVERMVEKLKTVNEHLVRCDTDGRDYDTDWLSMDYWTIATSIFDASRTSPKIQQYFGDTTFHIGSGFPHT